MSLKFTRRRPWLLIGRFSGRPASIVTLVVLAAGGLLVHGHGRPRHNARTIPTRRRNAWSPLAEKSTLSSSTTASCRSTLLVPVNRHPWATLRGGQQGDGDYNGADDDNYEYLGNAQQNPSPPDDYRTPAYPNRGENSNEEFYTPQSSSPQQGHAPYDAADDDNAAEMLLHETVQDRVNTWRQAQIEQSSRLQQSTRDDQGRIKLLTGVSRGSRAIIFVCLVFRNLHLFEVADQSLRGLLRLLVVTPLIGLFVANLAGVVASFTAPSHSTKKRLKAILNLDKVLEAFLIVWNVGRLTVAPSRYVPREVYVSSTLHSIFFILQCQAFTRLTWDENSAVLPSSAAPGTPPPPSAPPPPPASSSILRRESGRSDFADPADDGRWQDEATEVLI